MMVEWDFADKLKESRVRLNTNMHMCQIRSGDKEDLYLLDMERIPSGNTTTKARRI